MIRAVLIGSIFSRASHAAFQRRKITVHTAVQKVLRYQTAVALCQQCVFMKLLLTTRRSGRPSRARRARPVYAPPAPPPRVPADVQYFRRFQRRNKQAPVFGTATQRATTATDAWQVGIAIFWRLRSLGWRYDSRVCRSTPRGEANRRRLWQARSHEEHEEPAPPPPTVNHSPPLPPPPELGDYRVSRVHPLPTCFVSSCAVLERYASTPPQQQIHLPCRAPRFVTR